MALAALERRRAAGSKRLRFYSRYPQWWAVGAAVLAWIALFAQQSEEWMQRLAPLWAELCRAPRAAEPASLLHWSTMCAAMMLPLALEGLKSTAERSMWSRRHRAMAFYLAGFLVPWLLLGLPVLTVAGHLLEFSIRPEWLAAMLAAAAAVGKVSNASKLALAACHFVQPLAPVGPKADLDCLKFGLRHSRACLVTCGLSMAAMSVIHSLWVMATLTSLSLAERYRLRSSSRIPALAMLVLAALLIISGRR